MKLAIIDIGSNSVRLMMWADGKTLYKRLFTTRLGKTVGILAPDSMQKTAEAISIFQKQAQEEGAERIFVFATAAVRSAKNRNEFCDLIFQRCGLTVDVVSGQKEAFLGLYGAVGQADGAIIDIGGASTEICSRANGSVFSTSLDIGAVRLFEQFGESIPLLKEEIARRLNEISIDKVDEKTYVIGGTGTTVASLKLGLKAYDASQIQNCRITVEEVEELIKRLSVLSVEERKKIDGMDERRADIIVGGALLLHEIMKKLSLQEVYASDSDNLEGYMIARGLV